ncbi:NADP-dependent oxidoreductase [Paenibacillus sp. NPDC056579]|uniref:NADP-dependent oxidoreductase n=1 Tax=Paenibacillus sp. NPDC056579 TaxID=3345871 RepID=UPI0036C9553A
MKAIVMHEYGAPEVLQELEVDIPELKETQILVEVHASSVNATDYLFRSGAGKHLFPLQFPHILGVDVAGVVTKIGEKVTHVKPGDRVMGLVTAGGYADYVAVEANALVVIPPTLSFQEAAALPAVSLTAWQALFQYGKLQPGQRILIHAGAGGVGHIAVQLAKQHGAYVIATARTQNHEFVRQMGADEVIDYTTTDFAEAVSSVDIVLDMVMKMDMGVGETALKSYTVLKDGGKLISLVSPAIADHPKIRGIEAQYVHVQPNHSDFSAIVRIVEEQKLKVHVDGVFPFTAQGIAEAHHQSESKHKRGKVVIKR